MTQSRSVQALALTAALLTLTACGSPYYRQPATDTGQTGSIIAETSPNYYRGTVGGMTAMGNSDAMINANVINAIASTPGLRTSNLQVGTLQGIVTLRGTVDSQAAAQSAVQAARQVPGVQSVNYDLQVR